MGLNQGGNRSKEFSFVKKKTKQSGNRNNEFPFVTGGVKSIEKQKKLFSGERKPDERELFRAFMDPVSLVFWVYFLYNFSDCVIGQFSQVYSRWDSHSWVVKGSHCKYLLGVRLLIFNPWAFCYDNHTWSLIRQRNFWLVVITPIATNQKFTSSFFRKWKNGCWKPSTFTEHLTKTDHLRNIYFEITATYNRKKR